MNEIATVLTVVGLGLWGWLAVVLLWSRFNAGEVLLPLEPGDGHGKLNLLAGIVGLLAGVLSLFSHWNFSASSDLRAGVVFLMMGIFFTMRHFARPRIVENGVVLDSGRLLRWRKLLSFEFEDTRERGVPPSLRLKFRGVIPVGGKVVLRLPPDAEERVRELLLGQGVVEA